MASKKEYKVVFYAKKYALFEKHCAADIAFSEVSQESQVTEKVFILAEI